MSHPATRPGVSPSDRAVVAGQLEREPRGLTGVAVRCPSGYPAIIESAPVLPDGSPNPTLLYVTCPTLDAMISRAEGSGGVRDLREQTRTDPELRAVLENLTRFYRRRRGRLFEEYGARQEAPLDARLDAGIGGPLDAGHASCLHAYAAAMQGLFSGWLKADDPSIISRTNAAWERFLPPIEQAWCTDSRCARWRAGRRRAVIDMGTISVRLLVADVADSIPWTLVREAEVTRLGQGMKPGGLLDAAARTRTATVVGRFVEEARSLGVEQVVLAGTSATRDAADGHEFVEILARDYDLTVRILSGAQEAELAYAGASLDVSDPVVLDVGGGSTELVTRLEDDSVAAESLQLGASRATERWIEHDPPTAAELADVEREAVEALGSERERFGARARGAPVPSLVGVAGTVTTLAALVAGLDEYDSAAIHLRRLTVGEIQSLTTNLAALTTEQRAALSCVQAGRAPVIVAGAVILATTMKTLGYDELTVSERDLLDGLAIADS